MLGATELKAMYRRQCAMPLIIRRYSGTGANRPYTDYSVMGNIRLYAAKELIGSITQGDHRAIVLAQDLDEAEFSGALKTTDKVVWNTKEMAIIVPGTRCARDGTLIAYEIQARG